MTGQKTRSMILCALFAALIAAGAFLRIPIPVVPFTLQYLFTMLAGLLLGPRLGATAVGVYIVLGLAGLPVFTQGGGPGYIFQPTFGYIIGFALGAYLTGKYCACTAAPFDAAPDCRKPCRTCRSLRLRYGLLLSDLTVLSRRSNRPMAAFSLLLSDDRPRRPVFVRGRRNPRPAADPVAAAYARSDFQ